MKSAIRKWGNSAALRLPAKAIAAAGLEINSPVEIEVDEGQIVIRSAGSPEYSLEELLAACPAGKVSLRDEDRAWLEETPTGEEIW